MTKTRIAIGADHGGFEQKDALAAWLVGLGYDVEDFGCYDAESVDYPDFAKLVADAVASGQAAFGVLVCGTGIGMMVAANKVRGIRAANLTTPEFAVLAREHNDANVATLSGRFTSLEDNKRILEAFLNAEFAGGRHERRVSKIAELETRD